ncbi:hypothetical protein Bbelb_354620 [Branchiostoma belcheri]|nr:hypothetical protein Bbelb_354620 [Branchiostoma belcheri]
MGYVSSLSAENTSGRSEGYLTFAYEAIKPSRFMDGTSITTEPKCHAETQTHTHEQTDRLVTLCEVAENCTQHPQLVHWTPKHGRRKTGRPATTFIDCLKKDTGLEVDCLSQAVEDRDCWAAILTRVHVNQDST